MKPPWLRSRPNRSQQNIALDILTLLLRCAAERWKRGHVSVSARHTPLLRGCRSHSIQRAAGRVKDRGVWPCRISQQPPRRSSNIIVGFLRAPNTRSMPQKAASLQDHPSLPGNPLCPKARGSTTLFPLAFGQSVDSGGDAAPTEHIIITATSTGHNICQKHEAHP